ncbi:MAG: hypothetical protein R2734_06120 [Nocardioides sp.]
MLAGLPGARTPARRGTADLSLNSPDLTLDGTASFSLPLDEVGSQPVDVDMSTSSARSDAMAAWQPWADQTTTDALELPIRVGEVVCIRYRVHHPDDTVGPWFQQCTARGWRDEAFASAGDVAEVPARDLPPAETWAQPGAPPRTARRARSVPRHARGGGAGRVDSLGIRPRTTAACRSGRTRPGRPRARFASPTLTACCCTLSPPPRRLRPLRVTKARKGMLSIGAVVVVFPAWYPFDAEVAPACDAGCVAARSRRGWI